MSKILLTVLDTNKSIQREDHPMSLAFLATFISRAGHQVKVYDDRVMKEPIIEVVRKLEPDFVGISCMTHNRNRVFELCKEIKEYNNNIQTVIGGPHCITTSTQILKRYPTIVNYVIRGYGEQKFLKLIEGNDPSAIEGISFHDNGRIIETDFTGTPDLGDFTVPDYTFFDLKKYSLRVNKRLALPIFTSRGCCNKCVFCVAGSFSKKVVFTPIDMVFENINSIKSLGYNAVRIQDDTFGMRKDDAYRIMEYLQKKSMIYSIKTRIDILDESFIYALKNTGCYGIKFGVESAVPHVLKAIQKKIDLEKLENIIQIVQKTGIKMGAYILIGNPQETYDDAMKTIRFCGDLKRKGVQSIPAIGCYIFPGTELESIAEKEGIIEKNFDWSSDFIENRNQEIGYDPAVPIYISKHIGYKELLSLSLEYNKYQNHTELKRVLKKYIPNQLVEHIRTIKAKLVDDF